jgi:fibronectin type 3 domain-containing protein
VEGKVRELLSLKVEGLKVRQEENAKLWLAHSCKSQNISYPPIFFGFKTLPNPVNCSLKENTMSFPIPEFRKSRSSRSVHTQVFRALVIVSLAFMLPLLLSAQGMGASSLSFKRLTTNGRVNPLGIPASDISFGWSAASDSRGTKQQAYQVRVGTSAGLQDVWDSGQIQSERQVGVSPPSSVRLQPATRYYWQVRIWDTTGNVSDWSSAAWLETGLLAESDWAGADWITRPSTSGTNAPSLPLLRGQFVARAAVASARVYASAQGLYEVSINGQKTGDQFLAPGWTNYDARIQSQTYDVTNLVQTGTNVIGAALADGWFRGKVGIGWTNQYGTQLAFVAKIKVTYVDGSTDWFATNSGWQAGNSPYVAADLQDGETYNANLEQPGWSTAAFDASGWSSVAVVTNISSRLVPQPDEPVRQITLLTAKSRTEIVAGTFIYDLGQNMVGVVKVRLSGTAGQTITLRHGEEIYRTGTQTGQLYTANLRTAKATDTYTFATSGTVTYQPKFTQHGFRYVEITGTQTPPAAADVQGVVISSDLAEIGDLQTSNSMLNQLVSNTRWGQRSNFLSIPTDTPARDERLGWTGDISVFAPAAARYKDTRAFLMKWMADVRDAQKPNGNIPAVVPQPGGQFDDTGVGWSDSFITVPYSVWRATGDEQILRENWTAMKAFYSFVYTSATADGDLLEQGRSSWFSGDWLSLEANWNRLEEHKVIATAYFAEDTRMMSEMAAAMGESAQSAQWAALVPQIRSAFVSAYRSGDGSMYQGTQCAYDLALGMGMIADSAQRNQTAARFVAKISADNFHLQTGFLGTPWLLPALAGIGRNDLAFRLLLNQDYPSWGFPISMGATTNWERWNSIQPDGTFGDVNMNSFNHYAYGAVADWMFGNIGGIQALAPGYKQSLIAPLIGYGALTSATCSQETVFGHLATNWSISGQNLTLQLEVPVNTSAVVFVPASAGTTVYESGVPAQTANGVQLLQRENSRAQFLVGSGTYVFTSVAPLLAPPSPSITFDRTSATLTWASVQDATGYNIKRSPTSGGPYTTIASGVAATSYTDSGLVAGNDYYYVVSAVDATRESDNSTEAIAQPRLVLNGGFESPVTSTYVYNPSGNIWTFSGTSGNGSGVSRDGSVFTASNPNAPEGAQVAFLQKTGSIAQTVSGLTPGAVYAVVFSAANRATSGYNGGQSWDVRVDGNVIASYAPGTAGTAYSTFSTAFKATAASQLLSIVGTNLNSGDTTVFIDNVRMFKAPQNMPFGVIATPGNGSVSLAWQAATSATSYKVKRSLTSGGPYTTIAPGLTGTTYSDITAINGVTYYYVVSGVDATGESDSFEVRAIPNAATVSVPNFGFETPVTSTYAYNPTGGSWTFTSEVPSNHSGSGLSANGSGFTSSNSSAPQGTQVAFLQNSTTISQTLSGFAPGGRYTVTFSAANRATSGYSTKQSWDVKIDETVAASFSSISTSYADCTASFTASASAPTLSFVGTSGTDATVFLDNIRISVAPPAAPANLSAAASPSNSQISLAWTAASGASSYLVKRANAPGGPYAQLAVATGASYTDTAAAPGSTYFYVVGSLSPAGTTADSAVASATAYTAAENWRYLHFGITANVGIAADSADPDGDGMSNAQERIAGTDPNDRASVLKISELARSGPDIVVSFPTVAGKTYRLEASNTLAASSWITVQDHIAGTGGVVPITDSGGATQPRRFYRVIALP